jgi:hypothetical protein
METPTACERQRCIVAYLNGVEFNTLVDDRRESMEINLVSLDKFLSTSLDVRISPPYLFITTHSSTITCLVYYVVI